MALSSPLPSQESPPRTLREATPRHEVPAFMPEKPLAPQPPASTPGISDATREAPSPHGALLAGLTAEFRARGWQPKDTTAVVVELAAHLGIALGGAAIAYMSTSLPVIAAGLLVSTYGTLGVATNTHTSTHHATSRSRQANVLLSAFGYPLFVGLSMTYWHRQHVQLHHASPNVVGVDPDHDFMPYFATTQATLASTSGVRRFYYEHLQAFVFPLIVWLNSFLRQRTSWIYVLRCLRDPRQRRPVHWLDLSLLALHYVLWIGVPAIFVGIETSLALYCARMAILGYGLFAILAPAHYPAEAVMVDKDRAPRDFILAQTATTVNFRTGPIGGFVCSGLQYQIEHHLFPGYSHTHYRKMSPLVREFCERHGYPYRSYGWGEALGKVLKIFSTPKRDPEDIRPAAPLR